jgi:hypothetical protein
MFLILIASKIDVTKIRAHYKSGQSPKQGFFLSAFLTGKDGLFTNLIQIKL